MTPGPAVWLELFASTVYWFLSRITVITYLSSHIFLLRRRAFTSRKLYVCLEKFLCFLQLSNRAFVSQVRFISPFGCSALHKFNCSCLRASLLTVLRVVYATIRRSERRAVFWGGCLIDIRTFVGLTFLPRFPPLLKCFRLAYMWRITIEDHSSLMIGYDKKHARKAPWKVILKMKRYGTGLTQRVSMEDGRFG